MRDIFKEKPLVSQRKLLRFLEIEIITKIEGRKQIYTNARVISSTNKEL